MKKIKIPHKTKEPKAPKTESSKFDIRNLWNCLKIIATTLSIAWLVAFICCIIIDRAAGIKIFFKDGNVLSAYSWVFLATFILIYSIETVVLIVIFYGRNSVNNPGITRKGNIVHVVPDRIDISNKQGNNGDAHEVNFVSNDTIIEIEAINPYRLDPNEVNAINKALLPYIETGLKGLKIYNAINDIDYVIINHVKGANLSVPKTIKVSVDSKTQSKIITGKFVFDVKVHAVQIRSNLEQLEEKVTPKPLIIKASVADIKKVTKDEFVVIETQINKHVKSLIDSFTLNSGMIHTDYTIHNDFHHGNLIGINKICVTIKAVRSSRLLKGEYKFFAELLLTQPKINISTVKVKL